MTPKERYLSAHKLYYEINYPNIVRDGLYTPPIYPKVETTSGIEKYCTNMIIWNGGNMTSTKSIGMRKDKKVKSESGDGFFMERRVIRSTRKGRADLGGGIRGYQLEIEVKNKYTRDTMKDHQWKEKSRIERGGGMYWIVTCVEDFLIQLDGFLYGQ